MKLSIVIPAYNEAEAIGRVVEGALAARACICERAPVSDVEIIVVNDGSTDATADIVAGFAGVRLVNQQPNRGYGAALKRGFAAATGDVLGFMDGDDTCDPRFFADLCAALDEHGAAIAVGSRMGPQSRMPAVRRLGNRIYAGVLSVLSNQVVHDVASGMRVLRRTALTRLSPLPDGLHFTPAMSARALLDDKLPVVEVPMPYADRVGQSKLSVLRDGLRFFRTILEMTLFWRPARVFISGAVLALLAMALLAAHPVEMWLRLGRLEESMIYRLLFCSFLGSVAVLSLSALVISEALHGFSTQEQRTPTLLHRLVEGLFSTRGVAAVALAVIPAVVWLVGPGLWTRMWAGHVDVHWSRVVLAGLLTFGLSQICVTRVLMVIIGLHLARQRYDRSTACMRPSISLTRSVATGEVAAAATPPGAALLT